MRTTRGVLRGAPFVTTIVTMTIERTLADVKARFSEMIELVESGERIVVTKRGKPAAVLISADELDSIEETLDLAMTPGALEDIKQARAEIDAGHYYTADDVRRMFLKKRK